MCTSLLPLLVPPSPRFCVSVPVGRAWSAAQGKEVNTGNGGKNLIKRILSLSDFYCKSSDLPVNLGKVAELSLYQLSSSLLAIGTPRGLHPKLRQAGRWGAEQTPPGTEAHGLGHHRQGDCFSGWNLPLECIWWVRRVRGRRGKPGAGRRASGWIRASRSLRPAVFAERDGPLETRSSGAEVYKRGNDSHQSPRTEAPTRW